MNHEKKIEKNKFDYMAGSKSYPGKRVVPVSNCTTVPSFLLLADEGGKWLRFLLLGGYIFIMSTIVVVGD